MSQAVWIARHGERIDFVDPDWTQTGGDPYDPHLSPNGMQQAKDVARRLKDEGISHIFSSPFLRTLQTANEVAELLDLPIYVEPGAGEMLSADWYPDGDPRVWSLDDRRKQFSRIDLSYEPHGVSTFPEDWEIIKRRGAATMRAIVEKFSGNLFVVGHGASVSSLAWGLVEGYPQFTGKTCSLVKVTRDGEKWNLELGGDTSHLSYVEGQTRFH